MYLLLALLFDVTMNKSKENCNLDKQHSTKQINFGSIYILQLISRVVKLLLKLVYYYRKKRFRKLHPLPTGIQVILAWFWRLFMCNSLRWLPSGQPNYGREARFQVICPFTYIVCSKKGLDLLLQMAFNLGVK